jgi:hypothetical protein
VKILLVLKFRAELIISEVSVRSLIFMHAVIPQDKSMGKKSIT